VAPGEILGVTQERRRAHATALIALVESNPSPLFPKACLGREMHFVTRESGGESFGDRGHR
jgi:hypothetical protein